MRPDPPSAIRTVRPTRLQRVRNLLSLALAVAAVVAVVINVWPRRHDPAAPPDDVPAAGPLGPMAASTVNGASGLRHPGILVTVEQLELVRARVRAGEQPWADAFANMRGSEFAKLNWQPQPRAVVECGPFSDPDYGCTDEWRDAVAAYTQALMWYFTGDRAFAQKAVEIINAWSTVLRSHTNSNAPIQAGWSGAPLVRAAELLRYTYDGWPADEVSRAEAMFRDVYLPQVGAGGAPNTNGNWDLIILDAAMGIAVFLDDRPLFDQVAQRWRARLPAYIYLTSDGPYPVGPPGGSSGAAAMADFWFGQTAYADGLTQETCRDLGHTGWGLEAMSQIAETAGIQGVDLYAEAQQRLVAALEFHAGLATGDSVPGWLCGGTLKSTFDPIPELAYNRYHNELGVPMPRTAQLLDAFRPQPPRFFFSWETLTTVDIAR